MTRRATVSLPGSGGDRTHLRNSSGRDFFYLYSLKPNLMKETSPGTNFQQLRAENIERLKELAAINRTTQIIKEGKPVEETLRQVCMIIPPAWQYPQFTAARISFDGKDYFSNPDYKPTRWIQQQNFETIDGRSGMIEVCYLRKFPDLDEGPFLLEERHLIENLANMLAGYINSVLARGVIVPGKTSAPARPEIAPPHISSRQLLQRFLNKSNQDRDIYHDLMPFKVKEILLVANLYDAYSIEKEGRFSEHVLGEYHTLSLSSVPRITGVSSVEEALEMMRTRHFDLIIIMMGSDKSLPINLSGQMPTWP